MHPSVLQGKDPIPSPPTTEIAGGFARCHVAQRVKQNKEVQVKPRTGKDIPKLRNMTCAGSESALSFFFFFFKKIWSQNLFLCGYTW